MFTPWKVSQRGGAGEPGKMNIPEDSCWKTSRKIWPDDQWAPPKIEKNVWVEGLKRRLSRFVNGPSIGAAGDQRCSATHLLSYSSSTSLQDMVRNLGFSGQCHKRSSETFGCSIFWDLNNTISQCQVMHSAQDVPSLSLIRAQVCVATLRAPAGLRHVQKWNEWNLCPGRQLQAWRVCRGHQEGQGSGWWSNWGRCSTSSAFGLDFPSPALWGSYLVAGRCSYAMGH